MQGRVRGCDGPSAEQPIEAWQGVVTTGCPRRFAESDRRVPGLMQAWSAWQRYKMPCVAGGYEDQPAVWVAAIEEADAELAKWQAEPKPKTDGGASGSR